MTPAEQGQERTDEVLRANERAIEEAKREETRLRQAAARARRVAQRIRADCGVCGVPADELVEGAGYAVPRCAAHVAERPYQAEARLARAADHNRVLEQELARAREERDAFDATWQAATKRREAAEKSVRVLVEMADDVVQGRGVLPSTIAKARAALETVSSGDVQEGER